MKLQQEQEWDVKKSACYMRDPAALDWPMQISFYESHGEISWNMNIHGYVSASFSILLFRIFMN